MTPAFANVPARMKIDIALFRSYKTYRVGFDKHFVSKGFVLSQ
jgi:hypothetical protein